MITIEAVSERRWPALVELFVGSEECSSCWCMNHRRAPAGCPTGDEAREALRQGILDGSVHGLLALEGARAVGWCAVDPVETQVGHDFLLSAEATTAREGWMIHCVYVEPSSRGRGVSRALLEAAVALARSAGAASVLAFPIPDDRRHAYPPDVAEFSGRISTFRALGFAERERIDGFYQVMEKRLHP